MSWIYIVAGLPPRQIFMHTISGRVVCPEMRLNVEYSECTTSFILVSAYEYSFGGFSFYPHFRVANKLTID